MAVVAPAAVDEFGREHFTVDATPGRLGISLGENDSGFAVVCALDPNPLGDVHGSDWRTAVRVGDRLVQIEGEDVVHCSLAEVISRLGKLADNNARRLTFARYHDISPGAPFSGICGRYDVEKLVHVRGPSGPLGLVLDDSIKHGAFIRAFQPLSDGSIGPVEMHHPRVHRGCQIVAINGSDVSSLPREEIQAMLATVRDQEKELVLYRAAPASCVGLVVVATEKSCEGWHGLSFDQADLFRWTVTKSDSTLAPTVEAGDRLIAINSVDVACTPRREVMKALTSSASPMTLVFSRQSVKVLPECHKIHLESGPLGLNLDSQCATHAVILGFTTPADANRPAFQACAHFLPGSFVIAINKLDVHQHSLAAVSQLLMKLRNHEKDIVVGNAPLMERLKERSQSVRVDVPPGPLGLDFDGSCPEVPRVAGFFPMADGRPGAVEQSGLVPIGATIQQVNNLDVSCLSLAQVTSILKKMADKPKTIRFSTANGRKDPHNPLARQIRIPIPPGPLGIDLKSSVSGRVVVDRLNRDPKSGPTIVCEHSGVVVGSELLAIDGFDVASAGLPDVTNLLKSLSSFEKVITFSTTPAAYSQMLSPERNRLLKRVIVTRSPLGIEFASSIQQKAVISGFARAAEPSEIAGGGIPIGSQLIALEDVDLRVLSLHDVATILKDFAGIQKALTFLLPSAPGNEESQPGGASPSLLTARNPMSAETPLQRASSVASAGIKSPLGLTRENSMPPAPLSLQPLEIRPLDASRSLSAADTAKATKKSSIPVSDRAPKTSFAVTMPTWTGGRAPFLLSVDASSKSLRLVPIKPTSPKSSKDAVMPLAEVTAVDWGKGGRASPSRGLFRSASSLTSSGSQRYMVSFTFTGGKKSWELDMRSPSDRDALQVAVAPLLPELKAIAKPIVKPTVKPQVKPTVKAPMEGVFVPAVGDDSGQETPAGFRNTPTASAPGGWSRRRRSGGATQLDAATQRATQAPTQADTQAATEAVTQLATQVATQAATEAVSQGESAAPVFVVADPVVGLDEEDGPRSERQAEEVDEDETQIVMMSLSQGHEAALRAAAGRISEEDISLDAAGRSISLGAEADAPTEDGADSDLSDDMLDQDGAVGISTLANLFNRPDEDDEPRKKPTSLVYAPHSSFRPSPANSWRDGSESSGGETELEPEHEDGVKGVDGGNTAPDAAGPSSVPATSPPDTPQQGLRRSLSTPERDRRGRTLERSTSLKRQQQKPGGGGAQLKRIRLGSAELRSQATVEQDELDQSTQSLPPKSRRRIPLVPTPSPARSRSTSVHSESTSDAPQSAASAESAEVRIVLTGLEPTAAIRKQIKAIAGATYQSAVEDATHVVAPRDQLKRTVKLLCGISCCAHILDERWLDESARMGSTVDEKAFCLKDEAAEAKWGFSLRETMYAVPIKRRRTLFAGLRFFITNHKSVLPPVRDLVKIVECAGGQASFKGSAGPGDIVVTSEAAAGVASVQKTLVAADRDNIFTPELILTSILQQHVDRTAHRLELPASSSRAGKGKRGK